MVGMYISCKSQEVLVDEQIDIHVEGLLQGACITIQAVIKEGRDTFTSCGWYTADDQGVVDVTRQPSVGGSYTGIEPMGLIWSLQPAPGQRKGLRLRKANVTSPQIVTFYAYRGHIQIEELFVQDVHPLAFVDVKRWYMSEGVQRHQIKEGNIRGALFIPKGNGPFPGIIDMFGGAGGLAEYRASLLASRGFLTLALAYFDYQDLSTTELSFYYFMEAVAFLNNHSCIQKGGIGLIGLSKGGEFANLMSVYCPEVKAVVTINGFPLYIKSGVTDMEIEPYSVGDFISEIKHNGSNIILKDLYLHIRKEDCIKVWENDVKFLNICGSDDQNVHPRLQYLQYEAFPEDKKKNIELVVYESAGHLIEPPHSPLCTASYIKIFGTILEWGGKSMAHARAQEDSWKRILNFFAKHLSSSNFCMKSRL